MSCLLTDRVQSIGPCDAEIIVAASQKFDTHYDSSAGCSEDMKRVGPVSCPCHALHTKPLLNLNNRC